MDYRISTRIKRKVIRLHKEKLSQQTIANAVYICQASVARIIKDWKEGKINEEGE